MLKTLNLLWRRHCNRRRKADRKRRRAAWKIEQAKKQDATNARLGAIKMEFLHAFGFWASDLRKERPLRQCLIVLMDHANCVRKAYEQMTKPGLTHDEHEAFRRSFISNFEKYSKVRGALMACDPELDMVIPDWENLYESIDAVHIPTLLRIASSAKS